MFDIIPAAFTERFDLISNVALLMVGFLLGGRLTGDYIRQSARNIIWISICAAIGAAAIVFLGLISIGTSVEVALLLGCVASATAPAATTDIVIESGFKGPFPDLLLSIVALDDVWGLLLFSLGVAVVMAMAGASGEASPFLIAMKEIGGSIALGALVGFPAAYLTGRIRPGQPMLTEALGIVFLCGGLAIWFEVSFLIASIVMGAVVANFARHHEYPFHAIEDIEWPFMALFFVLAGASLEFSALKEIGFIGLVYIVCRVAGKITGVWLGGRFSKADRTTRRWIGVALLPQAGVAIGMALVAGNQFPEYRQLLLSVVISTTVFFEIIGPVFTRFALQRTCRT